MAAELAAPATSPCIVRDNKRARRSAVSVLRRPSWGRGAQTSPSWKASRGTPATSSCLVCAKRKPRQKYNRSRWLAAENGTMTPKKRVERIFVPPT
uniref:Uncharacterized protein n=1 Tax=Parascaris univalens TaxID=6257 RepID=A0A915A8G7_PARUN